MCQKWLCAGDQHQVDEVLDTGTLPPCRRVQAGVSVQLLRDMILDWKDRHGERCEADADEDGVGDRQHLGIEEHGLESDIDREGIEAATG